MLTVRIMATWVNPARAGMIPRLITMIWVRPRKPRASGDDPGKIIDHYWYHE